jgi:GT2 family glycosyltransferase
MGRSTASGQAVTVMRADLVTVYHNDTYYGLHRQLSEQIKQHEPSGGYRLIGVDNRTVNRGFAAACNLGAFHEDATAPVIGFLNPDVTIEGPFIHTAMAALRGSTVITGCRFSKPDAELRTWGVRNWVCGAALFVTRTFFVGVGGFDTQFVWSWEETDLIRQAEAQGYICQPMTFPIRHDTRPDASEDDAAYKRYHFTQGERRYRSKWRGR